MGVAGSLVRPTDTSSHDHDTSWTSSQLLLGCLDMKMKFTFLNEKCVPPPGVVQFLGRVWNCLSCLRHKAVCLYVLSAQNLHLYVFYAPAYPVCRTWEKQICQTHLVQCSCLVLILAWKILFFLNSIDLKNCLGWFCSFKKRLKSILSSCLNEGWGHSL